MHDICFIHSSFDGHLGCFHVLAIVNRAAMNIQLHVSFQIMIFSRYIPRSGIARSYGTSFKSIKGELGVEGGEGNGTPLQYSCLENPRDGGAWWAAISGVSQSQTRLKQLSSSSSSSSRGWGCKIPILITSWRLNLISSIKQNKRVVNFINSM